MRNRRNIGRLVQKCVYGAANDPIDAPKDHEREQHVHYRSCQSNQTALPARTRQKFVRRSSSLFNRIAACHANVTTQRKRTDAVIRIAALYPPQTRAEADGEDVDANSAQLRDNKMAPFVEQHEDAQNNAAS